MNEETVLFSEMIPEPAWEDEFNEWYNNEHIPIRMAVPGFTGAQRYKDVAGPGYLAVYNMTGPDILSSSKYQRVKNNPSKLTAHMLKSVTGFTRYTGDLISLQKNTGLSADPLSANILYGVFFNVPEDSQDEFDAWYSQDHVPLLLNCKDWLAVKRYALSDAHPQPFSRLAIHYLNSQSALDSDERKAARATPWRDQLAKQAWFKGSYKIFEKQGPRFEPNQ